MNPTARLEDVARAAGVDKSTASRALDQSRRHRISAATRERVLAAAEALGYTPNALARGLRTARTRTLGIAVPQLANPVFAQIIRGAAAGASERGYGLVISLVEEPSADPCAYERLTRSNRVDGLLVATLGQDDVLCAALSRAPVPYVVVNRRIRGMDACIAFDGFEAARQATACLISLGHRRIAHLTGGADGYNGARRLEGFGAALDAAGLPRDPKRVAVAGYTMDGGERATRALLALPDRPTAILAATVLSAAGALKALHASGIAVPAAMSVLSIHDAELAEMLHPPLTALRLPTLSMGATAAHGLVDLLEGKATTLHRPLPPHELVIRESTRPPPAEP